MVKHQNNGQQILNQQHLKQTLISEIQNRFTLEYYPSDTVNVSQISSVLDLRYQNLDHEAIESRDKIRSELQNILETSHVFVPTTENLKTSNKSAMEFLYGSSIKIGLLKPSP